MYAGLLDQVLQGVNSTAILEDRSEGGKLLLVDDAGGLAEAELQNVLFDGSIGGGAGALEAGVDLRDVVSGKPIAEKEALDLFLHRVNFFEATTDVDYFVSALEACEKKFSQKILATREMPVEGAADAAAAAEKAAEDERLPAKEYLYRNIIPALLPALEACQRDRPPDPVEFIALYMLRHPHQYSKSLQA